MREKKLCTRFLDPVWSNLLEDTGVEAGLGQEVFSIWSGTEVIGRATTVEVSAWMMFSTQSVTSGLGCSI